MNYKLRHLVAATLAGTVLLGFGANAVADTTDDIVNALIAKGVLTEEEGQLLINSRELEKTAKAKVPAPKFKDGLVFENEDKSTTFQIGGRIHADYRAFDHGNNENVLLTTPTNINGNSPQESDTFDIRRARLEFKGHFYDNFDFLLSADAAGQTNGNTGAILDQAWLNISHYKPVQFRVGQFKVPMSMERKMSSNALDFMERSQHDTISTYEDRGAMIWGVPKDGLTYALAVVNGEGNKNRNDSDSRVSKPEFQANATINFAQLMDNKDAVYHLGFGASTTDISKGNGSNNPAGVNSTFWFAGGNTARTEARGISYLTMPSINSINGVSNEISRQRYNLEAAVAYGPVKVVAEYLKNDFSGDLKTTSFDKSVKAWYASALWNITGEKFADFYKEGIFTAVKPKNNFDFTKFTGGAWQLGARYSKFDASDFNSSVFATKVTPNNPALKDDVARTDTNSNTFEADAYTIGLNYIPNPNVRFMLNYIKTNFDTPILIEGAKEDSESAITARAQFTF